MTLAVGTPLLVSKGDLAFYITGSDLVVPCKVHSVPQGGAPSECPEIVISITKDTSGYRRGEQLTVHGSYVGPRAAILRGHRRELKPRFSRGLLYRYVADADLVPVPRQRRS